MKTLRHRCAITWQDKDSREQHDMAVTYHFSDMTCWRYDRSNVAGHVSFLATGPKFSKQLLASWTLWRTVQMVWYDIAVMKVSITGYNTEKVQCVTVGLWVINLGHNQFIALLTPQSPLVWWQIRTLDLLEEYLYSTVWTYRQVLAVP